MGTFHIQYGEFLSPVCRLDVYFPDAVLSIVQHKAVGYEVAFTGRETRHFPFAGLEREFGVWLDAIEAGREAEELSPEEGLVDLGIIEDMCQTSLDERG